MKIKKEYYLELNSLRGLAAISVIFWHYSQVLNDDFSIIYKPYLFFMYGTGAVIMFFILSCFVLTASLKSSNNYLKYLIKRVFRIYPAYLLSLFISITGYMILKPHPISWLSSGFNLWCNGSLDLSDVLNSLVLLNPRYFNTFVTPSWSLTIEMTVSIVFPLFVLFISGSKSNYLGVFYIVAIYVINKLHPETLIINSIYYSIYFVMGILVYLNRTELSKLGCGYLMPIYIILYASPFFSSKLSIMLHDVNLLTGIGASGIILCGLHSAVFKTILRAKIFVFLGKISYSVYLLHMPILLIIIYLFLPYLNISKVLFLYPFSFMLTIFVSYLSYKLIELNFITLGKMLTKEKF